MVLSSGILKWSPVKSLTCIHWLILNFPSCHRIAICILFLKIWSTSMVILCLRERVSLQCLFWTFFYRLDIFLSIRCPYILIVFIEISFTRDLHYALRTTDDRNRYMNIIFPHQWDVSGVFKTNILKCIIPAKRRQYSFFIILGYFSTIHWCLVNTTNSGRYKTTWWCILNILWNLTNCQLFYIDCVSCMYTSTKHPQRNQRTNHVYTAIWKDVI